MVFISSRGAKKAKAASEKAARRPQSVRLENTEIDLSLKR